eukprot:s671_g19.t1
MGQLQERLFTRRELMNWILAELHGSGRFDVGRRLSEMEKDMEREKNSFQMISEKVDQAAAWDDDFDVFEEHHGQACLSLAIHAISVLDAEPVFFRTQVHAAMTAADIQENMQPALDACRREPDTTILCFLDEDFPCFARAIADAQQFMRRELKSASAVSQRDIIRVVSLLDFFWQRSYSAVEASERCRLARALLLALGVAYYLGLKLWNKNREQRDRFVREVTEKHYTGIQGEETQQSLELTQEMDQYMKPIKDDEDLADGIALTRALKENFFAFIVGMQCNIPVTIVGMPGTGKTLAVNKATSVLRGTNSVQFFRHFSDVANSVFRYQCSKDSTSRQIHEASEPESQEILLSFIEVRGCLEGRIFCCLLANKPLDAAKRNRCLQVFRDRADEEDLEQLGVQNRISEDEEETRSALLFFGIVSSQLLASVCLGVSLDDPTSKSMVRGFCGAFQEISEQSWKDQNNAFSMFHLRDFHHCLRYLRRHGHVQSGSVTSLAVLQALERNFGGLKKEDWRFPPGAKNLSPAMENQKPRRDFQRLIDIFFQHLERETGGLLAAPRSQLRSTLEVLREALADLPPEDLQDTREGGMGRAALGRTMFWQLQDARYEPCRYKLIIDETEDGGAVRILQAAGLLSEQWEVLEVSDLPGDRSDLHRSQTVSHLRRAAEQAGTCVPGRDDCLRRDLGWFLVGGSKGFYDLLNLRFQRLPGSGRVRFAATVAAGSYSVLAPVDPRFMLVVCIKA